MGLVTRRRVSSGHNHGACLRCKSVFSDKIGYVGLLVYDVVEKNVDSSSKSNLLRRRRKKNIYKKSRNILL